ncbi:Glyoxalase/Bleomycin resistance protein/Dioxygenase superfamily protein [Planctomycetes bacterium MalM25]|nr:Glyoxalase/Bleomycin resistance protein/Dioxygenase superfamily protein [Planctomycetes bacterium MalM25]
MSTDRQPHPTGRRVAKQHAVWIPIAVACLVTLSPSPVRANPQEAEVGGSQEAQATEPAGKVIGIKYNCVHVLQLEKTLKLYGEILGFKMADAEVLHAKGIEGMLIMKMKANDFTVCLSLPAPGTGDSLRPIGNTNHNHFMLLVDNIVPICDQLKEEGYALENEEYARDKYSFFTGPNGEIIGLTEYK